MKPRQIIPIVLTLAATLLAAPLLAAPMPLRSGAQLTYEVPLYNPAHPNATATGNTPEETRALRAEAYGSYTLADILAAMIQGITPGAIGAAPTVHVHAGTDITGSTTDGRALLTGTKAMQKIALEIDQVNNTSDLAKPISTATQAALDGKLPLDMAGVNASAARDALGLGTIATAASGTGIGQHPPLVDVGYCSNPAYTDPATCQTNGGDWISIPGWRLSGADYPPGALTVGGVTVPTVDDIAWAALPDKPGTFPPDAHSHDQTDITGLVARLVALEDQVTQLDANLSLAGFPTLTIDQASPVTFTAASTDLTGTYADNGTVTALEYNIDGGAWANITPLQSPWSLTVAGASLTPNVASTVTLRATDDTALARTKSVSLTYQTPVLSITPASHTFVDTEIGSSSPTQQFVVNNTGQATGNLGTFAKGGTDPGQFGLSGGNCTSTLAPGASCIAGNMVFSPTTAGAKSATLTDGTLTANLSGAGVAAETYSFYWDAETTTTNYPTKTATAVSGATLGSAGGYSGNGIIGGATSGARYTIPVSANDIVDVSQSFTMQTLVRATSLANAHVIFGQGYGFQVRWETNGQIKVEYNGGGNYLYFNNYALSTDTWYRLTVTSNRSAQELKISVQPWPAGSVTTKTLTGVTSWTDTTPNPFQIAGEGGMISNLHMDEVKFWKDAQVHY